MATEIFDNDKREAVGALIVEVFDLDEHHLNLVPSEEWSLDVADGGGRLEIVMRKAVTDDQLARFIEILRGGK